MVLLCVACLAAGAVAAVVVVWDDPPDVLASPVVGGVAAVTQLEFADPQSVTVEVTRGAQLSFVSPASGVVSASSCAAGAQMVSGGSAFSVDGVPVVALATAAPLWRDIVSGDSGPDVAGLATELARLGRFSGDPAARAGTALIRAFQDLATSLGAPGAALPWGTVPQSLVAWLPAESVAVSQCQVSVASRVSVGADLALFDTPLSSARIVTDLSRFAPGERVLTIGDAVVPVGDGQSVSDPGALAGLAANPQVRYAPDLKSVNGKWTLAAPVTVAVVPAAAIQPSTVGSGCVVGDGRALAVTIVSSQLGSSYVSFAGPVPAMVDLDPPAGLTC